MLIELSPGLLVVVNVLAWLAIHLGVAWSVTQLAESRFTTGAWLFRRRGFEDNGELYDRLFRVSQWKRWLPDGAALFKRGFRKKRLLSRDPAYLARFARETCRGELAHWLTLVAAPLFFLWNPTGAGLVMIAYGVLASLPFIIAQRYNRFRLERLIAAKRPVPTTPPSPARVPLEGMS
jgi:glycosyl-4,4'-diaponeurosporenoate acyltransferase